MLRKIPLVRLVIPYILGILFSLYFRVDTGLVLYTGGLFLLLGAFFTFLRVSYNYRFIYGIVLHIVLFFFGVIFTQYKYNHIDNVPTNCVEKKQTYVLQVLKAPKLNEHTVVLKCKVIEPKSKDQFKAIVYLPYADSLKKLSYGNVLLCSAVFNEISPPMNPGEFNYKKYISYEGFHYKTYLGDGSFRLLPIKTGNAIMRWAAEIRNSMLTVLKTSGLSGQEFAVASALLLGYESEISEETSLAYAATGALHVLSVSGMHVAIIYAVLLMILGFFDRFKNGTKFKYSIIFLLIWGYAFITGLSPSVLRATTMFSFILCARAFSLQTSIYNTLSASAFLLLIIDPLLIMQVGFQLSYLAVIGIVALYQPLYEKIQFNGWLLDKSWSIICVSIAAQLATSPISIYYFHQFPVYFLLSNLLVIPVSTFVMGAGALGLLFGFYLPISNFFGFVTSVCTKGLNQMVGVIQYLPLAIIDKMFINELQTFFLYLFIVFMVIFLFSKRKYFFFLTIIAFTCFSASSVYKRYTNLSRKQLLVYHIPKSVAIDYLEGDHVYELSNDRNLLSNSQKVYFVDRYRNSIGIRTTTTLNGFGAGNYFLVGEKRVLWLTRNDKNDHLSKLKLDVVILSAGIDISIADLLKNYTFNTVVFDCSNKKYQIQKWEEECKRNNVTFYNMYSRGAFVLNI